MSSMCGSWLVIELLHQHTFGKDTTFLSGGFTFNSYNDFINVLNCRCRNLSEYMKIAEKVKEFFHNEGIHSTTIQPEFVELEQQSVTGKY